MATYITFIVLFLTVVWWVGGGVSETRPPTSATILIILISLLYYIEVGACLRTLRIMSPDHHWQANRNKMATMKRRGAKDYITHSITKQVGIYPQQQQQQRGAGKICFSTYSFLGLALQRTKFRIFGRRLMSE